MADWSDPLMGPGASAARVRPQTMPSGLLAGLANALNPINTSGDPGATLYHILDIDPGGRMLTYCDNATGDCYQCSYTMEDHPSGVDTDGDGDCYVLGVPTKVSINAKNIPVMLSTFALDGEETKTTSLVIKRGKIFQAGNYPDKKFTLTPAELLAAVEAFTPQAIDIEHESTVFDGKLGQLLSVELSEDGHDLYGEVALPVWVKEVLGDGPLKVSCTWDRQTKQLAGLALVNHPRVPDAALMSAFAAFSGRRHNGGDQAVIQAMHDLSKAAGAACAPGDNDGDATMKKETAMADETVTVKKSAFNKVWETLTGAETEEKPGIHIHLGEAEFGLKKPKKKKKAAGAPRVASGPKQSGRTPDGDDTVRKNYFSEGKGKDVAIDPEVAKLQDKLAKAEKKIAKQDAAFADQRAASQKTDAASFADTMVTQKRAFPVDRDAIVTEYLARAEDDQAMPKKVTFKSGDKDETGTRVEAFKAMWTARPAHQLTEELLANGDAAAAAANFNALANKATTELTAEGKPMTDARRKELLGMSAVGQTILKDESQRVRV